jgi:hypothetical protein
MPREPPVINAVRPLREKRSNIPALIVCPFRQKLEHSGLF